MHGCINCETNGEKTQEKTKKTSHDNHIHNDEVIKQRIEE